MIIESGSEENINVKRIKFQSRLNQNLFDYFNRQAYYNKIYMKPTDYHFKYFESYQEKPKIKIMNKNDILEVKFDMLMKTIESKKLIDYINKMTLKQRAIEMIKGNEIKEGEFINLCFEISIQSKDAVENKIPQLYKFVSFLNYMGKINEFLNKEKYNDEELSLLLSDKNYFSNATKIIDFNCKIVILLVCEGIEEDFLELKNNIQKLKIDPDENSLKSLKKINENSYNIFLVYYPIYDPMDKIYKMMENLENEINGVKTQLSDISAENKNLKKYIRKYQKSSIYSKKILKSKCSFQKK